MSQKFLNHNDRNAIFQQMRGKAVSQSVRVNHFGNPGFFTHRFDDPLYATLAVSGIEIFIVRSQNINLFNISILISIE